MNVIKRILLVFMVAIALPYASGCALDEVAVADEPVAVVSRVGYGYGYYAPCSYDYNVQCWYPAPPTYIYGGPIIWGPRWRGYPGYRPGYRPGPGYRGGWYGGGGWGRGGGRGGHR